MGKIILTEEEDCMIVSSASTPEQIIKIKVKKIIYDKCDTNSELIKILIDEIKSLKEENKAIKEQLNQLNQFKTETEQKRINKEKDKYNNIKDSNIVKNLNTMKMISDWIMPNKKIIYNQIYKASRDEGIGKSFHSHCTSKDPL